MRHTAKLHGLCTSIEPSHRISLDEVIQSLEVIMTEFPQNVASWAMTQSATPARNHVLAPLKLSYLNEGPYGVVFKASLGKQDVAVKYYKKRNEKSDAVSEFLREFTVLTSLRRQGDPSTGLHYFLWPLSPSPETLSLGLPAQMVFPFANGRDLNVQFRAVRRRDRERLSDIEVFNIFEGLLEAIQTLRGSGLVHSDIKPDSMSTHTYT